MNTKNQQTVIILMVILVGFGLRVYQLGHDSFWNDEAGQALAAIQPTVTEMLSIVRTHAMAMPLDYFLSRLTSRVGVQETIMRFPALVFGTLTLTLYYSFVRSFSKHEVALTTAWLLALYAPHIAYSQEMRFYAALSFFYVLSNILLFRALRDSSCTNWTLFVFVTSLGSYFHPYTLLVTVNGFLYILARFLSNPEKNWCDLYRGIPLFISTLVLGLAFLPGYQYFGAGQTFNYELLQFSGSLPKVVGRGVGWLSSPYSEATPIFGVWELTSVIFMMVGIITSMKHFQKHLVLGSVGGGACIQIFLIVFADWANGYWFVPRQLLHLAPTALILTSLGIVGMLGYFSGKLRNPQSSESIVPSFHLVVVLVVTGLIALPRISDYYSFPKSNGEQLAFELQQVHQNDLPVYVIPGHEEKVYRFYLLLDGSFESSNIIQMLRPTNWNSLQQVLSPEDMEEMYLIMPAIAPDQQEHLESLKELGFTVVVEPDVNWYHARYLLTNRTSSRLDGVE